MDRIQQLEKDIQSISYSTFHDILELKKQVNACIDYLNCQYQGALPDRFPYAFSELVGRLKDNLDAAKPNTDKRFTNSGRDAFEKSKAQILIDLNAVKAAINDSSIILKP